DAAHDVDRAVRGDLADARLDLRHRDVDRPGRVARHPLVLLAHVEQVGVLGHVADLDLGNPHAPILPCHRTTGAQPRTTTGLRRRAESLDTRRSVRGVPPVRQGHRYLSSRDILRSASGLPPVWQVGQYCSEESAKDTSRIVSPQTSHGWPVRLWTRSPDFFSALSSPAARPRARSTASCSVVTMASCRSAICVSVSVAAILKGDIFAACSTSSE